MNMKKLLSLLLALAMVFSLAACAGSKGDDDDDEEEAKVDDTTYIDAAKDFYKSRDVKTLAKFIGGSLLSSEIEDYVDCLARMNGMDAEELISSQYGSNDLTISDTETEELTEDEIADFQDQLDSFSAARFDSAQEGKDTRDEMDDSDWEEVADRYDMSVDDVKDLYDDLVKAVEALGDVTKDVKITAGYHITVTTENDDGVADQKDCYMLLIGNKWFSADLFDFFN